LEEQLYARHPRPPELKAPLLSTTYYCVNVTRTLTRIIIPRRKAGMDLCLVILCEDSCTVRSHGPASGEGNKTTHERGGSSERGRKARRVHHETALSTVSTSVGRDARGGPLLHRQTNDLAEFGSPFRYRRRTPALPPPSRPRRTAAPVAARRRPTEPSDCCAARIGGGGGSNGGGVGEMTDPSPLLRPHWMLRRDATHGAEVERSTGLPAPLVARLDATASVRPAYYQLNRPLVLPLIFILQDVEDCHIAGT